MSELTFEQMLEESLKTIHAGEVVEGETGRDHSEHRIQI